MKIFKSFKKGIKNKDDLAELSIDELKEIIDINEEDASKMIMKARDIIGLNKKENILKITVKDFAKTLKISDKALIERMQKAGLSHSKNSDEITPSDKQALLKSLKGTKSKSVTSESESQLHQKEDS